MLSAIHGGAHWQPQIRATGDYDRIVAADVNDAWYPPSPAVLETIALWAGRANHSPDTSCRSLRENLAKHFHAPVEALRLGAGSSDLLNHAVSAFVEPGCEMLTLSPTYAEYARAATLAGASVRLVCLDPANDFSIIADAVLEAVRPETRLIVLCNPNNPTGGVLARAEVLRFLANLSPRTLVLVDEAYIDFAPLESVFADAVEFPNLAVVRTFSKAYAMAGLRVGYAALGERACELFDRSSRPPWPVGLLGLRAAEEALEQHCYVEGRLAEYARLKSGLIRDLGIPAVPSVTHYFLIDLNGTGIAACDLVARLREREVFLRDFSTFCDFLPQRFVRITTQSEADNQRIAEGVRQVVAALV